LIGGGRTAPDRAAFYNAALARYLDFNDSFLASGETCHPSDNFGSILAAAEYAGQRGRELLTALAVAYQVQCWLSEVAPVRAKGFDHTTQVAYAVAAGVSKALGLNQEQTANAIAIAGTAFNALRVTRTRNVLTTRVFCGLGELSEMVPKGISSSTYLKAVLKNRVKPISETVFNPVDLRTIPN